MAEDLVEQILLDHQLTADQVDRVVVVILHHQPEVLEILHQHLLRKVILVEMVE
jgi:hypothetical protein